MARVISGAHGGFRGGSRASVNSGRNATRRADPASVAANAPMKQPKGKVISGLGPSPTPLAADWPSGGPGNPAT
jgi:hypothetical protein